MDRHACTAAGYQRAATIGKGAKKNSRPCTPAPPFAALPLCVAAAAEEEDCDALLAAAATALAEEDALETAAAALDRVPVAVTCELEVVEASASAVVPVKSVLLALAAVSVTVCTVPFAAV